MLLKKILIGLLGYLFIGLFLPVANGQTMSNQDYIIKTESLDPVSATTEQNYNQQTTPSDPSISEGVNFKVKSGFDSVKSDSPFSVSLSSDLTDFGPLSPTNSIIRTIDLNISNQPQYGYSVIASENNPLKSDKTTIPDTTCDDGTCNQETSGEWTNALTYGLGYRCDNLIGNDCDSSFLSPNFYKHFPDASNSQPGQSIMAGLGKNNKSVRLSYKVNTSGSQQTGAYTNIITFIAVPNF